MKFKSPGHSFLILKKLFFIFLLCLTASTVNAQLFDHLFNPTVKVNITHPPGLNIKLNKVAFGESYDSWANQIIEPLKNDFITNQVEVYDREHLYSILRERHLSISNGINKQNAASLGQALGPTTLIFVKVLRAETKHERAISKETRYNDKTKKTDSVKVYLAKTRAEFRASIQAVDLASGTYYTAQEFVFDPEKVNRSYEESPSYPSSSEVFDIAAHMVVNESHKLFLPWSEQKELVYYDDKNGGLKEAYKALKEGDVNKSLTLSKQNVEACKLMAKKNDKLLSRAYYNLGTSYMIVSDYGKALENFNSAQQAHSGEIIKSAIADCHKAMDLASAMKQIDDKAAFDAQQLQAQQDQLAQQEAANTLTNADIIKLAQLKLSDMIIITKIRQSKCNFDTGTDALGALSKSGVSEKVIMAMLDKK